MHSPQPVLVGELDTFSVGEVLQFGVEVLAAACVRIWDDDKREGRIELCDGAVRAASVGHLAGAEAALAMIMLKHGRFEVSLAATTGQGAPPSFGQLTALLLEAARISDELERFRASMPPRDRTLQARGAPEEDRYACGIAAVATALQAPQSLAALEMTLPLCAQKIQLAVCVLAEGGFLGRAPALVVRPTPPHLIRCLPSAIAANGGVGHVLVAYPGSLTVASVNAALGRVVAEVRAAPLSPVQELPSAGPAFVRIRPATGGVLSLTFLAAVERNAVFLEALATACNAVVLVGDAPKGWAVRPTMPVIRTAEQADTWLIRALIECFPVPIPSPSEAVLK